MIKRLKTPAKELCPTCNDLHLNPLGDWAHREVPFTNLTKTANSGCGARRMLLGGILTRENDIPDLKRVFFWSFGK
jgi:hypothetical protein